MSQVQPVAVQAPRRRSHLLRTILLKAVRDFSADDVPNVAASVTFYALLAIFPALSALMSLYGLFGDPTQPQKALADLRGLLPQGAVQVIGEDLERLSMAPPGPLGVAFAVQRHAVRRLGGITGDVLGALAEIAMTVTLVVAAMGPPA